MLVVKNKTILLVQKALPQVAQNKLQWIFFTEYSHPKKLYYCWPKWSSEFFSLYVSSSLHYLQCQNNLRMKKRRNDERINIWASNFQISVWVFKTVLGGEDEEKNYRLNFKKGCLRRWFEFKAHTLCINYSILIKIKTYSHGLRFVEETLNYSWLSKNFFLLWWTSILR